MPDRNSTIVAVRFQISTVIVRVDESQTCGGTIPPIGRGVQTETDDGPAGKTHVRFSMRRRRAVGKAPSV